MSSSNGCFLTCIWVSQDAGQVVWYSHLFNNIYRGEVWCWIRLLKVLCTTRRSNQSVLKEINPEYLLKGLIQKLKLQYFGHLMQRAHTLEKTLMLVKIEGRVRRG